MFPSAISMSANRIAVRLGHWPGHGRAWAITCVVLLVAVVLAIGVTVWDLRRVAGESGEKIMSLPGWRGNRHPTPRLFGEPAMNPCPMAVEANCRPYALW